MGAYHLIVHNPFGSYQKGAHIRDDAELERVLAGPNHRDVLRIAAVGVVSGTAPAPADVTPAQGAHA
jgi:hypothetical protein